MKYLVLYQAAAKSSAATQIFPTTTHNGEQY